MVQRHLQYPTKDLADLIRDAKAEAAGGYFTANYSLLRPMFFFKGMLYLQEIIF